MYVIKSAKSSSVYVHDVCTRLQRANSLNSQALKLFADDEPLAFTNKRSLYLPLDILDFVVEKLHKDGNHTETSNDGTVVCLPG